LSHTSLILHEGQKVQNVGRIWTLSFMYLKSKTNYGRADDLI